MNQAVMDRRTFLNWVGVGLLANYLPIALAACSSKSSTTEAATGGFRTVGTMKQLEQDGQILNEQLPQAPVLVVQDSTNSDLVAINPICTHRDCAVEWKKQRNVFLCTCHDSEFDTTGQVLSPPAKIPLVTYAVKTEGDRILVGNIQPA